MNFALSVVVREDSDLDLVWDFLHRRSTDPNHEVATSVAEFVARFRATPSLAILENNARQFDATAAESFDLWVKPDELEAATVEPRHLEAIQETIARVRAFHEAQLNHLTAGWLRSASGWEWSMPSTGSRGSGRIGQRLTSVRRAGIYVPGGKATYPSSVIMNAVPALVAGVDEVVMATPARMDGSVAPAVLVAAGQVGIRRIAKVGGAAAACALGLGYPGADPVDVLVGPGNAYLNEAKRLLWGAVGLDGIAGSSEVCVVADDAADPRLAAIDLLTQVEHAEDNFGALITLSAAMQNAILRECDEIAGCAERALVMRRAIAEQGLSVVARNLDEAARVVDRIAPEHLSAMVRNPRDFAAQIRNAGCILLGPWTAQSAADYWIGPSHTLPTAGAARFGSPVSVLNFLKTTSVCELSESDAAALAGPVGAFGKMEGLPLHGDPGR